MARRRRGVSRWEALAVLRGERDHWKAKPGCEREVACLQRAIDVLNKGTQPSGAESELERRRKRKSKNGFMEGLLSDG